MQSPFYCLLALFLFVSLRVAGAPVSITWFLTLFAHHADSRNGPQLVFPEILAKLPWTLELLGGSFIIAAIAAVGITELSVRLPMQFRRIAENVTVPLRCIPYVWLVAEFVLFVVVLNKASTDLGAGDLNSFNLRDRALHLLNPAICLALFQMPFLVNARSFMDLVRAFVRALPEILGAVVITELMFAWPGDGRMFYYALTFGGSLSIAIALVLFAAIAVLLVRALVPND